MKDVLNNAAKGISKLILLLQFRIPHSEFRITKKSGDVFEEGGGLAVEA